MAPERPSGCLKGRGVNTATAKVAVKATGPSAATAVPGLSAIVGASSPAGCLALVNDKRSVTGWDTAVEAAAASRGVKTAVALHRRAVSPPESVVKTEGKGETARSLPCLVCVAEFLATDPMASVLGVLGLAACVAQRQRERGPTVVGFGLCFGVPGAKTLAPC